MGDGWDGAELLLMDPNWSCLMSGCWGGDGDAFGIDSVDGFPPPRPSAQQGHLQKPVMVLHGLNLLMGVN